MGEAGRKRRWPNVLPRYLERRAGGIYGCRLDIPERLRSHLGRRKFVLSHNTRELSVALQRHKPVVARLLGLLASAEAATKHQPERLTPVQLEATIRQIVELLLAQLTDPLSWVPVVSGPLAALAIGPNLRTSYDAQALAEVSAFRRAADAGGDDLEQWRDGQLHQAQVLLGRVWHPDDRPAVAMAHHQGVVLALRGAAGRQVDWERYRQGQEMLAAMPDPAVVLGAPQGEEGAGITLDDLVTRWIEHRRPAPKTAVGVRAVATKLTAVIGSSTASAVDVKAARAFRDARLEEVSAVTARKDLALLRAVWSWATGEELVGSNPWDLVRVTRSDRGTEPRQAFNGEQVDLILRRCQAEADPAMRWCWPVSLMTGLRLEEFACLRRQDLQVVDGIRCLAVAHDAQLSGALKTRGSERTVPLPEALLAMGFWDWATAQPEGYLFDAPSIPAADPRRSHSLSIRAGIALRGWGITSKRLVFHSCRHTFCARAVESGLEDRMVQTLMGHSTGKSMTSRYSGGYTVAQLKTAIDQLAWPVPGAPG